MSTSSTSSLGSPDRKIAAAAERAVRELRERGWGVLPDMVDPAWTERALSESEHWPSQRVHTGSNPLYGSYERRGVPEDSLLGRLLAGDAALALARQACGQSSEIAVRTELWMHRYVHGEILAPHKDVSGNVQLAIALRLPPEQCGGHLYLRFASGPVRMPLSEGAGVLFHAREVEHFSERVVSSVAAPHPEKIMAVGRYHLG